MGWEGGLIIERRRERKGQSVCRDERKVRSTGRKVEERERGGRGGVEGGRDRGKGA